MIVNPDCRYFDGYRPCRFQRACEDCPHYDRPLHRVLIVNLDALGDVIRTTALLGPLHRALPDAHVTWITDRRAVPLLDHVDGVDRVLPLADWTGPLLRTLRFDLVLGVDKSLRGGALTMRARAHERRGFGVDVHGSIVALDGRAGYLYKLGLDDPLKFFINDRPETQLLCEALGFEFHRDPYRIGLSPEEESEVERWRRDNDLDGRIVVGFNTGSSTAFPYKHLTVEDQAALVDAVASRCPDAGLVLLGGPEDAARNPRIADRATTADVIQSPTDDGLRVGLQMVDACDVVVTGDSLGMHMAIGLGKPVVVWFGLTCHQEIDLYGRGVHVLADVDCRPCWQRSCDRKIKCFESVPLEAMADRVCAIVQTLQRGQTWEGEILVGDWPPSEQR